MTNKQRKKPKNSPKTTLIYDVGLRLGEIAEKVHSIEKIVSNHLIHDHKRAQVIGWIQTLIIVILFSYFKWGQ